MEGFAEVAWEGRPCYINPRDKMRHLRSLSLTLGMFESDCPQREGRGC